MCHRLTRPPKASEDLPLPRHRRPNRREWAHPALCSLDYVVLSVIKFSDGYETVLT